MRHFCNTELGPFIIFNFVNTKNIFSLRCAVSSEVSVWFSFHLRPAITNFNGPLSTSVGYDSEDR